MVCLQFCRALAEVQRREKPTCRNLASLQPSLKAFILQTGHAQGLGSETAGQESATLPALVFKASKEKRLV